MVRFIRYRTKIKFIWQQIFILPIKFYQIAISPAIGGKAACRFNPTCSDYAIGAIKKLGVMRGLFAAFVRILKCNPWGGHGHDPVLKK
jgi:uncharacterized protein